MIVFSLFFGAWRGCHRMACPTRFSATRPCCPGPTSPPPCPVLPTRGGQRQSADQGYFPRLVIPLASVIPPIVDLPSPSWCYWA
jgi:hypothetical protein